MSLIMEICGINKKVNIAKIYIKNETDINKKI